MENVSYFLVGGKFDGEVHKFAPRASGESIIIIETNDYTKQKFTEFYVVTDYLIPELPQYKVATLEGITVKEIKIAVKNVLGH
ncbi:hypothetical protein ACYA34_18650 [Klebsiella pneumoniae]|uniref:hypothetical protein n=1 Tax=Klebsiella TaxID=570 RepID=UPI000711048C|nr:MULTISPECIES: hypothetical protein [Klebsiella]HBR1665868.1 hypothetical protein [Klebsiella quasipneumoniae subsp. quasipneumoniae]ELA0359870.1 hypothetical protein [Klebsiella pneumoniae]KRR33447.1 hypothetical protein AN412_14745 [Klebsiella pneumoniae]MBA1494161.1 hypothetical protein [Klebsiella pneumoniae]MBC4068936.1 hypothetical protein [Klebsiella pneumoniae]